MTPKRSVTLLALPGTAWVELRSEKWEQWFGELGCGWDVPGWALNRSCPPQFQLWVLLGVADFNMLLEESCLRGFV